jgi:hypothetical protein
MPPLTRLLQDADPVRYEAPPNLDTVRRRIHTEAAATPAIETPVVVGRRSLVFATIGAAIALSAGWAWVPDLLSPAVAAQVRFEVRLAEPEPAPGLQVARVSGAGRLVYVHPETVVGNDDIAHASVIDNGSEQFSVAVQLLPGGADRMRQATAAHTGRPVVILLDGVVVMAPTVRSPIGDAAVISGPFTKEEAERIATGIERR